MPAGKFGPIYQDLKEKIETGIYPSGSDLPSEHQLITEYDCSRNTVRRALAMLKGGGYVQSIHGKGVQVIWQPTANEDKFTIAGIESFVESAKRSGLTPHTYVIRFEEQTVDQYMSSLTGFPQGSEVFYVQRARSLNDLTVVLDVAVFLKSEMPELTEEIASSSIYHYLEKDLGIRIVTSNRSITVEPVTPTDSRYLDLEGCDYVAVITAQTYNSNGVMFQWAQTRLRPDYFCFRHSAIRKRS